MLHIHHAKHSVQVDIVPGYLIEDIGGDVPFMAIIYLNPSTVSVMENIVSNHWLWSITIGWENNAGLLGKLGLSTLSELNILDGHISFIGISMNDYLATILFVLGVVHTFDLNVSGKGWHFGLDFTIYEVSVDRPAQMCELQLFI